MSPYTAALFPVGSQQVIAIDGRKYDDDTKSKENLNEPVMLSQAFLDQRAHETSICRLIVGYTEYGVQILNESSQSR